MRSRRPLGGHLARQRQEIRDGPPGSVQDAARGRGLDLAPNEPETAAQRLRALLEEGLQPHEKGRADLRALRLGLAGGVGRPLRAPEGLP
eukprot:7939346-Alexandrium_andersonii.AAC.1